MRSFLTGNVCSPLIAIALIIYFSVASAEVKREIDEFKAATIKAAYLRYIAEFTIWPLSIFKNKKSPIVTCIMGEDPYGMGKNLRKTITSGRLTAQGRPLMIRTLKYKSSSKGTQENLDNAREYKVFTQNIQNCHLMFLTRSEKERWEELRPIIKEYPIVVVSEMKGFSTSGGMIEFVIADLSRAQSNRVINLHINLEAVQEAKLRLSSKLLRIKQGVKIVKYPKGSF